MIKEFIKKTIPPNIIKSIKSFLGIDPNKGYAKISYSQNGEDLIIDFIFHIRGITRPTYIDIGAYQPYKFSNTAIFYKRGARGINIEPNPDGIKLFRKYRPEDQNLNIGVSDRAGVLDYFCMSTTSLNTCDEASAIELVQKHGYTIVERKLIPVESLHQVITAYAHNKFPDLLTLDVEGLDMVILNQIDYERNYPKVICVETIEYTNDGTGAKNTTLIRFLEGKDYFVFADTHINTIFINRKFWFSS